MTKNETTKLLFVQTLIKIKFKVIFFIQAYDFIRNLYNILHRLI